MHALNESRPLDGFLASLRRAGQRVLFLDYDGTLAPFVADRDRAVPYPGVIELIDRLIDIPSNRVVVVSGRSCASVLSLLRTQRRPEIWGSHGLEHLPADSTDVAPGMRLDDRSRAILRSATEAVLAAGFPSQVEEKPFSAAAHWRGLSPANTATVQETVSRIWTGLVRDSEFELHHFDGGTEMRLRSRNKGHAIDATLASVTGDFAAAYLGDDLTDEDAFAALGDRGLRVLVRKELRPTLADLWIRPPEELLAFLEAWETASRASAGG